MIKGFHEWQKVDPYHKECWFLTVYFEMKFISLPIYSIQVWKNERTEQIKSAFELEPNKKNIK